jgi:hypothetical protein
MGSGHRQVPPFLAVEADRPRRPADRPARCPVGAGQRLAPPGGERWAAPTGLRSYYFIEKSQQIGRNTGKYPRKVLSPKIARHRSNPRNIEIPGQILENPRYPRKIAGNLRTSVLHGRGVPEARFPRTGGFGFKSSVQSQEH